MNIAASQLIVHGEWMNDVTGLRQRHGRRQFARCVRANQTARGGGIRLDVLISRKRIRVTCNEEISTKPVLLKI